MSQATVCTLTIDRLDLDRRRAAGALLVLCGSLVLWASSRLALPLPGTPVPLTLQTFAVLVLGMVLGPRRAAAAAGLYALEALAAPGIFTASGRFALTGGFLLGFVPAAYLAGALFERGMGRGTARALLAALPANLVIFAVALPWLAVVTGSFSRALEIGFFPFLIVEALKIALTAGLFRGISGLSRRVEESLS